MKWNMQRNRRLYMAVMVLCIGIFAGCAKKSPEPEPVPDEEPQVIGTEAVQEGKKGTLLIKVNPEIAVEYDGDGKVTDVRGLNEDGKKIVEGYEGYEGKACHEVVEELVGAIHDAGYFVEEVEGVGRKITIEIETGSIVPEEDFLDEIVAGVQEYVREIQLNSSVEGENKNQAEVDIYDAEYGEKAYEAEVPPSGNSSGTDNTNPGGSAAPPSGNGSAAPPGGSGSAGNPSGAASQPQPSVSHDSPYTDYETPYEQKKQDSPYDSHYEDSGYSKYKEQSNYSDYSDYH